jgi:integrase/recombinase XerD
LDTKIKSLEEDPDKKCIITWNDYLGRIKYFMRWLYNYRGNNDASIHQSDWITPAFVRIKEKKIRRLNPYSETELWEREEILSIVKYEPHKRNKAALTLFWDLDARDHEVTLLKINQIRLSEQQGDRHYFEFV